MHWGIKMNAYVYSAKNNAFFPTVYLSEYEDRNWDLSDIVEISDKIAKEYMSSPPPGKIRVAGNDGMPAWGDLPPPSREELIAQAELQKSSLRKVADSSIIPLQDAVDMGMATDEEVAALAEWKKYRILLNRVVTTSAPNINWPIPPGVQAS